MTFLSVDTAWQLAAERHERLMTETARRRRRRVRPRPPVDQLPTSTPPDAA